MSIFATRLRELRGTESQASFASAIGINRVQYAKYESGVNSPSVDVLSEICRVHACSADWLLGLRGESAAAAASPPPSAPGSLPVCAKCPMRKRLEKLEKAFTA